MKQQMLEAEVEALKRYIKTLEKENQSLRDQSAEGWRAKYAGRASLRNLVNNGE